MKISKIHKNSIKKIAEKYDLKLILLFGSLARGQERDDSDVDIGVVMNKNLDLRQELSVISELTAIFKREVDLSILNHANPLLLHQATKGAVLLYGSEREYFKFRLYAFHRYNDYAPYFKMEEQLNKRLIKEFIKEYAS